MNAEENIIGRTPPRCRLAASTTGGVHGAQLPDCLEILPVRAGVEEQRLGLFARVDEMKALVPWAHSASGVSNGALREKTLAKCPSSFRKGVSASFESTQIRLSPATVDL